MEINTYCSYTLLFEMIENNLMLIYRPCFLCSDLVFSVFLIKSNICTIFYYCLYVAKSFTHVKRETKHILYMYLFRLERYIFRFFYKKTFNTFLMLKLK